MCYHNYAPDAGLATISADAWECALPYDWNVRLIDEPEGAGYGVYRRGRLVAVIRWSGMLTQAQAMKLAYQVATATAARPKVQARR
jgi:hypothetical protein